MKTAEKVLKQTILLDEESRLKEFCVEHLTNKNKTDLKRISKSQYKLINKNILIDIFPLKFPCYLAYEVSKTTILAVNKQLQITTPKVFLLMNKSFSFDIKKICIKLYNLHKSVLLVCKLIFSLIYKTSENLHFV